MTKIYYRIWRLYDYFTLIFTIYPLTYRQNIIKHRIQFKDKVEVDEEEIEKPPRIAIHEILSHPLLNEHKHIIQSQKEKDIQLCSILENIIIYTTNQKIATILCAQKYRKIYGNSLNNI